MSIRRQRRLTGEALPLTVRFFHSSEFAFDGPLNIELLRGPRGCDSLKYEKPGLGRPKQANEVSNFILQVLRGSDRIRNVLPQPITKPAP